MNIRQLIEILQKVKDQEGPVFLREEQIVSVTSYDDKVVFNEPNECPCCQPDFYDDQA